MLTGQYGVHSAAVMTFTGGACAHITEGEHVAECTVTLRASVDGEILLSQTVRMPVSEHMEPAAVEAMFQTQFAVTPGFTGMAPA